MRQRQELHHQPKPPEGVEQSVRNSRDALRILHLALESRWSTISVKQVKTKFSEIRCYVNLAADDRVWDEWKEEGNTGHPTDEFRQQCLIRDCGIYREVYLYLMESAPHLWAGLYSGADYRGLLAETREGLDELLDSDYFSGVPQGVEDDREALYKICDFRSEQKGPGKVR